MTTLEALTQTVQAIHGEVQQLIHAVQTLTADNVTTTATMNQLQAQQVQEAQSAKTNVDLINKSGDALTLEVRAAVYRLSQLEQQATAPSGSGHSGKKQLDVTRPKYMEPEMFVGKRRNLAPMEGSDRRLR